MTNPHCPYWDSGWCYAPDNVETNATSYSGCLNYFDCPQVTRQIMMTDSDKDAIFGKNLKVYNTENTNPPIVPGEQIEKWKTEHLRSLCKELVDDLDAWMEYDAQPSRLSKEYRNSLELIYKVRRYLKETK